MGANAQTSVPAFTSGQVLTAAQVTQTNTGIPVFADSTARTAAFGGTGEKVLAEGQYAYLESDNSTSFWDGSAWQPVGSGGIAMFNETQSSLTGGGSSTSGSFAKRTLNTTVTNNISGCSIASSVVTLATAGTYYLRGSTPVYRADQAQARLRNTTASTTIANGQSSFAVSGSQGAASLPVEAYLTISVSTNIELQTRVATSAGSEGLGVATGFDENIYSTLYIERIA